MSCQLALIAFVVVFTAIGLLAGASVLAYEGWVAFWRWYDYRMQNSKRIKNAQIDYAFYTRQFYVPYGQRARK
jgi:hypothetical protein